MYNLDFSIFSTGIFLCGFGWGAPVRAQCNVGMRYRLRWWLHLAFAAVDVEGRTAPASTHLSILSAHDSYTAIRVNRGIAHEFTLRWAIRAPR
jgi:hypothetical protein